MKPNQRPATVVDVLLLMTGMFIGCSGAAALISITGLVIFLVR